MSPAPVLDLQQDPPAPVRRKWTSARSLWTWALWFFLAMAWGVIANLLPLDRLPTCDWRWLLPFTYVGIAAHEAGHLLVGMLAGMKPGAVSIGGFLLYKSGSKWGFRFDYRRLFSGGFAKPLPPRGEFRVAPFAWMVAAGTMTNLLLFAATLAWMRRAGDSEVAVTFLWANALLVIVSALPYNWGAAKSDGARLLLLLFRPREARAWMALLMIMTEEADGALPREWDAESCALAFNVPPDGREFPYRQLLAYYRALDWGREEEALGHLENALAHSQQSENILRHCFFLEASCASAALRKNVAQARVWLERARKLRKPESIDGIEAEIAMCEQRYDDVLRHTAAVRAYLAKRRYDGGLAKLMHGLMDELDRRANQQMSGAAERAAAGLE